MSKFIQIHFFYPSTFPLPNKQKWEKIKSFLSSHHFLSSLFFTPPSILLSVCTQRKRESGCTEKKRKLLNILINREREGLNILVIKIHLESNSMTAGVESIIANLFYFLHFEEVVGTDFYGFALQRWIYRDY